MLKTVLNLRFYSVETARVWLRNLNRNTFPPTIFTFRYDRSSGPGGQNVNKVNSKCTLTLYNASRCSVLPQEIRDQLLSNDGKVPQRKFRYYSAVSDSIVIQSDETRSRVSNKEICLEKFVTEIKNCCYIPEETNPLTKAKWNKVKQRSNEKRIMQKKNQSDKKKARKVDF